MKTEHNGAKNGGGAWMRRAEAKAISRKLRRQADRDAERRCGCRGVLHSPSCTPDQR